MCKEIPSCLCPSLGYPSPGRTEGSTGWEGFLQREQICLEQGQLDWELRGRGKGGTSFGSHSAEVVGLELNSEGL